MESWYAVIVGLLKLTLVFTVVLYYGFDISLSMPSIR